MRIKCLEVANFRRLESVRIDLSEDTTLLVGANNSGKTSAMEALRKFLGDGVKFELSDFTLSHLPTICAIGKQWEEAAAPNISVGLGSPSNDDGFQGIGEWLSVLPHLDLWIEAEAHELYRAPELLPFLDDYCGGVGIRLRLEPRDPSKLVTDYLADREAIRHTLAAVGDASEVPRLRPMTLVEFLEGRIGTYFEIKSYRLDPNLVVGQIDFAGKAVGATHKPDDDPSVAQPQAIEEGGESIKRAVLDKLVRVDAVPAQRSLKDDPSATSLSVSVAAYYKEHLDFARRPTPDDLGAILAAQNASAVFDVRLQSAFRGPLGEVARVGYPGTANPEPIIKTELQLAHGLEHESVLRYRVGIPEDDQDSTLFDLPEGLNGLGYQNLVLMIFRLMSFRDRRMRIGSAARPDGDRLERVPIHLVLVEEPEAHLHAQVQQVFIKQAYRTLTTHAAPSDGADLATQLVVSTHSSHVAHELEFEKIRYFCRVAPGEGRPVSTTAVKSLARVFGTDDETARFVKRYLKVNHCNLLFADAAVLVEGAAERILMPYFVAEWYPEIARCFVEYLEVGGAHAHRLQALLVELAIPTLVVTDIDAAGKDGGKVRPQRDTNQKTGSDALRLWLGAPESVDCLLDLNEDAKVFRGPTGVGVRFAYQVEVDVAVDGLEPVVVPPSTFEDALVLENLDIFAAGTGTGMFGKFATVVMEAVAAGDLSNLGADLYAAIGGRSKAEFALDLFMSVDDETPVAVPSYIRSGLQWLESQVRNLPVLPSSEAVNVGEKSEVEA